MIKIFAKIAIVPTGVLYPIVAIFCVLGAYASSNSMYDVWVMVMFGMIGFFVFEQLNIPKAPFIIARILGSITEVNLRRALQISDHGAAIFFKRPISLVFIFVCLIVVLSPLFQKIKRNRGKSL